MIRINQIINFVLLLMIGSCATPMSPTQNIEEKAPSVTFEIIEEVEEVPKEEIVVQEEIIVEEKAPTQNQALTKMERVNAVAVGKPTPKGIVYQRDSTQLSTQSFEGKYTVIDFWATWCGPCVKEGPLFHAMGKEYEDKNVQFVGVSVDRDFDRWNQFLQQRNWQGNNYWMGMAEEEAFFAFAYSEVELEPGELGLIVGLPKYVIIGPDGNILHNSSYIKPSNPKFKNILKQHISDK